ncbi:MAG: hypothetical protein ACE5F1_19855, partial [Planctomycetota bacterium]
MELDRYSHSGRVGWSLYAVLPFYLALSMLIGVLYQAVLMWNPWILLDIFVPLIWGALLGVVSVATLGTGRVRNGKAAWMVVLAVLLASFLAAHLYGLGLGRQGFPGVMEAVRFRLREGVAKPSGEGRLPPGATLIFWLTELALVSIVALALPLSWWHKAVFCEKEGRFLARRRMAIRFGPSPRALRQAALNDGLEELGALALRRHPERDDEGELRFYLHESEAQCYLTVQWLGKLEGPTGRKVVREVMVLRRVLVPRGF